jgi:HPt (histidine-containing phosphotransfer) domain-containing protein
VTSVNLNYLDEIAAGDENFKKDLVKIFLQQLPGFISNMKKFHAENDLSSLAREAHTAKSSVLIFGMEDTGAGLKKIQLLAEEKNTKQIPEILNQVLTDMESVKDPLQKIVDS